MSTTTNVIPLREARYLSTTEVAGMMRRDLKGRFPATRFSVRSKKYSMGSSINVSWRDGPTKPLVEKITEHYTGADFDGMVDLLTHRGPVTHNGEVVRMGVDFIFCGRSHTGGFLRRVVAEIANNFNAPIPEVTDEVRHKEGAWTYVTDAAVVDGDTTSPIANWDGERYWSWACVARNAAENRTKFD